MAERMEPLDEYWTVVVRPLKGFDGSDDARVKRWLKAGLRGYGLRCVEVRDTTEDEAEQARRAG